MSPWELLSVYILAGVIFVLFYMLLKTATKRQKIMSETAIISFCTGALLLLFQFAVTEQNKIVLVVGVVLTMFGAGILLCKIKG